MSHTLTFHVVPLSGGASLRLVADEQALVAAEEEGVAGELEEEAEEDVANPILPTTNELFYGAIFFFTLWALMKWVLLPPILKVQEDRAAQVRADKDAAEQAADEAARLRSDYEAGLASVRAEATRVIDDARHAGDQRRAEVMAAAEGEIAADRARAASEVEAAKGVALDELRAGVAGLAVEAAQLVVQKDIDAAAERDAIDDYVRRAGAR